MLLCNIILFNLFHKKFNAVRMRYLAQNKKYQSPESLDTSGMPGGIRTHDLRIRIPLHSIMQFHSIDFFTT